MKIILLCGSRFALPAMQQLIFLGQLTVVVIPHHCLEMIEQTEQLLKNVKIPLFTVQKKTCEEQLYKIIDEYQIDLGLVMTFTFKLTEVVYRRPAKGFFNLHPGPLPFYRGADPIFHQIKNREKKAGVTLHAIDEGYDTGPIVAMEMIPLEISDTYGILTTKLSTIAANLVALLVKFIQLDLTIPSRPQNHSKATYYKKQKAQDIAVNWQTMNADAIVALVNACNPWNKGAVAKIQNTIVRFLLADTTEACDECKVPGTIVSFENGDVSISTIGNQTLNVQFIYLEEGFLKADQLNYKGIITGMQFETLNSAQTDQFPE